MPDHADAGAAVSILDPAEIERPADLVEAPPNGPRSRRAILAAAVGGLAGSLATVLGRPLAAEAAAGDTLKLGQTNFAGGSATRLSATSSGGAFWMTQNGFGSGVRGDSVNGHGMVATTAHGDRFGLSATNSGASGTGAAINADGGVVVGIRASSTSSSAVYAKASSLAVFGTAAQQGVYGEADGTDGGVGVGGRSFGTDAYGVYGFAQGGGDSRGVYGEAGTATGIGVEGYSNGGVAILGSADSGSGIQGIARYDFGAGVEGLGFGTSAHGVVGSAATDSATASGVYGGSTGSSYAGYFAGSVAVTGSLSKGGGSFRIDHPLDPANRILQHSFVESPDMLNIYNGVAQADSKGEASVELPAWFGALNRDFRYSLTAIGAPMPNLYIAAEIRDNRFSIGGAAAAGTVSWQVTGIRKDAWANANRIEVELDKTPDQRGRYLHPIEDGQPASKGVDYPMQQRLAASAAKRAVPKRPR